LTTVEADPCFQACVNGFAEYPHPRSSRAELGIARKMLGIACKMLGKEA
jgi:hypothetical protein